MLVCVKKKKNWSGYHLFFTFFVPLSLRCTSKKKKTFAQGERLDASKDYLFT